LRFRIMTATTKNQCQKIDYVLDFGNVFNNLLILTIDSTEITELTLRFLCFCALRLG
jgi:hypothetical protein